MLLVSCPLLLIGSGMSSMISAFQTADGDDRPVIEEDTICWTSHWLNLLYFAEVDRKHVEQEAVIGDDNTWFDCDDDVELEEQDEDEDDMPPEPLM